jgi:hypothetical protein
MWGNLSDVRMGLSFRSAAALVSTVILGSESSRTHAHILLSQIRDSPNLEGQVPYLYPPGTGWPSYTLWHWVCFSSPPMTSRVTLEVFEPASMQGLTNSQRTIDCLCSLTMDRTEDTSLNSFSTVATHSYHMDCTENTASQLLHCCVTNLLPSNKHVCRVTP